MTTDDVSPLTASDRPRWQHLWAEYQQFYGIEIAAAVSDHTWSRIQAGRLGGFAAHDSDGQVVGIAHFLFHDDTWSIAPICYLQDLFVDVTVRRTGVGGRLIHAVAAAAKQAGASGPYWLTHETNVAGRRLYDQLGKNQGFIQYLYDHAHP